MGNFVDKQLFPLRAPLNLREEIMYHDDSEYALVETIEAPRKLIIYSHGNSETLDDIYPFLQDLSAKTSYSVMAYEYPNEPDARAVNAVIEKIYDFAIHQQGFEPENVILMGRSVGCGPTLHLAQLVHERIGFVVLVTPFVSVRRCVADYIGACGLGTCLSQAVEERYDNAWMIEKIYCPLLIIHGTEDKVISKQHSHDLFLKYHGENRHRDIFMVDGKDHNNIVSADVLGEKIVNFNTQLV